MVEIARHENPAIPTNSKITLTFVQNRLMVISWLEKSQTETDKEDNKLSIET